MVVNFLTYIHVKCEYELNELTKGRPFNVVIQVACLLNPTVYTRKGEGECQALKTENDLLKKMLERLENGESQSLNNHQITALKVLHQHIQVLFQ